MDMYIHIAYDFFRLGENVRAEFCYRSIAGGKAAAAAAARWRFRGLREVGRGCGGGTGLAMYMFHGVIVEFAGRVHGRPYPGAVRRGTPLRPSAVLGGRLLWAAAALLLRDGCDE